MEALSLAPRKLSSGDLLTALICSFLAHAVILFMALFLPHLMPRQASQVAFYTVNLISADELKGSAAPPLKGESSVAVKSKPAAETKTSTKKATAAQKKSSSPLVPVKRLQFDEAPKKAVTGVKKLETSELPKIAARTEGASSIEKDLDKLTKKPKSSSPPVPEPIQQQSSGSEQESAGEESPSSSPAQSGESAKKATSGTPEGSAHGSAQAGSGSGQVGLARRLYYTEIWNAIRSKWALPDFLKEQSLEAILIVSIRRDGKILNLRFEKRSGNALFDESAERAVIKADPLPPFPAIYSPPQEDIGVRFRPEDL
ncbi:MAG: TonB family protein [Desulforhabdus sp.]|jgi:TonB family protein|nr:TonB family protein [Desulforhabdus sp.]